MPFRSPKQRRYMHARHPEIADRWEREAKARGENPVQPTTPLAKGMNGAARKLRRRRHRRRHRR